MALAQQTTTSSFCSDLVDIIPNPYSLPMLEQCQSITFYNKDNQKPAIEYAPTIIPWVQQVKLIELEEYRGFSFTYWGKILVAYKKEDVDCSYNFNFVGLSRQAHNDFYPEPYLIICIDLELEGSGESKDAALDDLYQLFNVYFNRTREIYNGSDDFKKAITANINQRNPWKQSFARAYERAKSLDITKDDYHHQII